ncbi:MAG: hypothetical protein KAW67_04260, partial [Candidatus Eisenbacteria sp.]|nr:hypothetical protein [Candidatus Eisenbacteria bacterium]
MRLGGVGRINDHGFLAITGGAVGRCDLGRGIRCFLSRVGCFLSRVTAFLRCVGGFLTRVSAFLRCVGG